MTAGEVTISVTDNGVGIPQDLLPKVFELFVQGERTLDRSQGGLGIGLSIVKRLIEMHDGSVRIASDGERRGTTVRAAPAAASTAWSRPRQRPRRS